ncbi:MAG: hypothetical protein M3Z04_00770 [Chloroflexota bacterium]|nr:hypothetical protein [Chloroflexota bacterium]
MAHGDPAVIIPAYAVYPLPNSAEGIVNAALVNALRMRRRVALLTSAAGYQPVRAVNPAADCGVTTYADGGPPEHGAVMRLAGWPVHPKRHPLGALARLVDRARVYCRLAPLAEAAWSRRAAATILRLPAGDWQDAVVWACGTPPQSLAAAVRAFTGHPFPLVVNYNDPMPFCLLGGVRHSSETPLLDEIQHRQNAFLAAHAQAWTFPAQGVADLMIAAAGLDPTRCFIIPHLLPDAPATAPADLPPGRWLVYAGTFYRRLFTPSVKAGLAAYAQAGGLLRFAFVLKQLSASVRAWIASELPDAVLYADLAPTTVAGLLSHASALLVLNAAVHQPLLPSKVVQAVCSDKPILALAPPATTTGRVIAAAGGVVADPTDSAAVVAGLRRLEGVLAAGPFQLDAQRRQVQARFAAERIISDSLTVLEYARHRFAWQTAAHGPMPEPPVLERGP